MARKPKYRVEFVWHLDRREHITKGVASFVEQLRYAGILSVLDENDEYLVLVMKPPQGVNDKVWAIQNAKRISSFGIDAFVVTV